MIKRMKAWWSELKRGQPGSRFEEQYDKERRETRSSVGRVFRIIAGCLLFPVGVFFLAVPGPGLLVIAVGAVLIAREFRFAARVLDALEVRGRQVLQWTRRRWRRLVDARRRATR